MTSGRRLLLFTGGSLLLAEIALVRSPSFLFASALSPFSRFVCALGVLAWSLLGLACFYALRTTLGTARGSLPRNLARWSFYGICELAAFFLLVSSIVHVREGFFINGAMLSFFAADPRQVFTLLTPLERHFFGLVFAASTLLVILAFLLTAPPAAFSFRDRRFRLASLALTATSLACLLAYPRIALSEGEANDYRKQACYHSTAALALACAAFPAVPPEAPPARATRRYDGMGPYLKTVSGPARTRLNLVIVVVESLRSDSLEQLGARDSYMPFLDRMAGRGLLFSNAHSQSNTTHYSVTALLSSLFPMKYPTLDSFRSKGRPRAMVYEVLKALGYRTSIFSSHNDAWGDMREFIASPALDEYFYAELYDGPSIIREEDTAFARAFARGLLRKGSLDDRVPVARFLSWLAQGDRTQPFFSYLNFQATHFPYQLAFDMETPFQPSTLDFGVSFLSYPREKLDVMLNRYHSSLRFVDARIRDLWNGIAAAGHAGDTILVVTGDHGQSFFEHGTVTHAQTMYEEEIHVPLLIVGPPDVVPTRVDDRPVQGVDVVPTVLGLMGLPPHPAFQGRDVLRPARDPYDHALFLTSQGASETQVLIWRGFKYILRREQHDSLFNLSQDPGELRDLLDEQPATARLYRDRLTHFVNTQVAYYTNREYYGRLFPPQYE